ncbi:MAG TPA: hypothetical protein DSN98_03350 [Thermoplasmata archaeon]|jgi:hypothetical protein|nr:MAG TPA: hypothetical protein DSN98_03350 [Thermoplasmata archaeon]
MMKKLIGLILCMLLMFTPVVLASYTGIEKNIHPDISDQQPSFSSTLPKVNSKDGWELQWSHAYGGMGHSQLAQPVGDLDADGVNEIIVGGYENTGMCRILSYDAVQQTYVEEYSWYIPGGSYQIPTGACIFDLNEDGVLELVVAWGYTGADGVYAYTWDGTTLTTLDCYNGVGVDFLYDILACDYNDDGHVEVIVSNAPNMGTSPWHVYALRWEANHFVAEAFWACPNGASCECPMAWGGDVDNDGKTEIIADVSNGGSFTAGTWVLNWIADTEDWDAVPVWTDYGDATVYGDGIADIDADGTPEIGVGSYGGTPSGWLFEWNGTGYEMVWHGEYPGGEPVIESVALGDADNDGSQEFVFGTQQVHIIGWNGDAYYEKATLTDPQSMLAGMNIGDFDTDGSNELKACEIISGTGSEFIWKYHVTDTNPPVTTCTLTGELESDIYVSNVTVTLTATDNGSGLDYTTYKLDAGAWITYIAPFIVADDGNHTLLFYSVDRNGNTEQQKTSMFTIQQHPLINITLQGGKGISVIIENKGLLPLNKVPWNISLNGGIILKGSSKTGLIPQLIPGQQKTLTSSILGFGRTTITVSVGETKTTAKGFIILMFIIRVQ